MDLSGKTILVTGSSRGIGASVASLAFDKGARVICHGSTHSTQLQDICERLGAQSLVCNLRDEQQTQMAFQELELQRLDGLVNSAGTLIPLELDDTKYSDYQEAMEIHLAAPSLVGSLSYPLLKESGGSIVNVSSVRSEPSLTSVRSAPYCTMKSALHNLTCVQAKQYGPKVRCNTVSPGWVETDMAAAWNQQSRDQASANLLERIAAPEEVASAICFLLSDEASFITAQNLFVDGGYALAGK